MGLNEVALGIPVPDFWAQNMVRVIGARHTRSHVCSTCACTLLRFEGLQLHPCCRCRPDMVPIWLHSQRNAMQCMHCIAWQRW